MAAAQASAAVPSHSIDFINKDDAGGILFALLEQVTHAARAHAYEHLDEI